MDNSIYQYTDTNGDDFLFYISPGGNCVLEYGQTRKEDGSPLHVFITTISMADYNYLVYLLKIAIAENPTLKKPTKSLQREIMVMTTRKKVYKLDGASDPVRTVDRLVEGYKKKYMTDTALSKDYLVFRKGY